MKKFIVSLSCLLLSAPRMFAQDSCVCYIPVPVNGSDTTFKLVPLTEGTGITNQGLPQNNYTNDDASTLPIPLPFNFCFYGQSFDTVYINNNGNISFVKPIYHFVNWPYPFGTDTLMIAPFYANVDTYGGSNLPGGDRVYYKITPTYMIVQWNAVGFYDSPLNIVDVDNLFDSFQLTITNGTDPILPGGNNVSFCYSSSVGMNWACSDTSGGFQGFGGVPATVGVNKGNKINSAQFGTFSIPGTQYYGPFGANDGLNWLNGKSFTFNTCVTGNIIPPVILNGNQACDTFTVCALDTLTIPVSFLCPQQGQTCTISASSIGLTGISVLNPVNANSIASATVQVIPAVADTGIRTLNVIATDNSTPVLTTTRPFIVIVNGCGTGIQETTIPDPFTVYPNPGSGDLTLQMKDDQFRGSGEAKIYDLLGNVICSVKITGARTRIDVSSRPPGIYFLKLFKDHVFAGAEKIVIR